MEDILSVVLFILIVITIGYLFWLVRISENRPEYYERSKSKPVREVIDKYEPREK